MDQTTKTGGFADSNAEPTSTNDRPVRSAFHVAPGDPAPSAPPNHMAAPPASDDMSQYLV